MEFSSPLAAMRPQPCPAWGNRKDLPLPKYMHCGYQSQNLGGFDFKSLSMHQKPPKRDYFSCRPVRSSSPTSTLTADLGANFHIDQSPQAPTPRRALFGTSQSAPLLEDAGRLMTPPIESEEVTTPEILSSSPGLNAMDISPLPHKAPYLISHVTIPSPTPDLTPETGDAISSNFLYPVDLSTVQVPPPPAPTFLQFPERKRASTRPALARSKTTVVNPDYRSRGIETALPPFLFGNVGAGSLSCSSTPSLVESFTESPVETASPMPPQSLRRISVGAMSRNGGSQFQGHVRKPSAGRQAFPRPQRKQMRRSLSMFQHPDDVMREEQDTFEPQPTLASTMDVDEDRPPKLPCFVSEEEADSLPRISQDTMADILDCKYTFEYERILIVDCRFEYEYNGGHIENAVNFNDKQQLANELFTADASPSTLLVFHCEYSKHRAPMTAKFIRNFDRQFNAIQYPKLSYPEMYILDGGYSKFFENHRSKCYPQNYVEMHDQRHEQACERGMAKVKGRQKLFRAQTYAFGEHAGMDDSPTAQGRALGPRSQSTFSIGLDIAEGIGQSFARRMASY